MGTPPIEFDDKNLEKILSDLDIETTADIEVPEKIIDQVIGQEKAVDIMKKAALQRRHVLLIGEPGTGKSMLAQGMAQLLPSKDLEDILIYPNTTDENNPLIWNTSAGKGKIVISKLKAQYSKQDNFRNIIAALVFVMIIIYGLMVQQILMAFIAAILLFLPLQYLKKISKSKIPKLLVSHSKDGPAPFIDGTGAHAGALLGDVRHDPFQSGGLETPAHERVEPGAIHKAHKGVLYIDEIATLKPEMQVELLTALQEKKYPITGQSERSSGAMVRTQPVPCDFVLVASGNVKTIQTMNPALRSRIRGYGYEVYMNNSVKVTPEYVKKMARFVAQEVKKDKKIPHFSKAAVVMILKEAVKRSDRKGYFTLKLRELGGLARAAGDLAKANNEKFVQPEHVIKAKELSRTLEQQIADKYIEEKKDYKVFQVKGSVVGKVNGLAVFGDSGIVLPIEAGISPALAKESGMIIATGKLGDIAKEAIQNVSALIKKYSGRDISKYDIHIQFLQTYEGVEGDSASISVATAVISALEKVGVSQNIAMTGSLSVRGDVLPIGKVTAKIEAAVEAGIKKVLVPEANMSDIFLDESIKRKVTIIPVRNIGDVLEHALDIKSKKDISGKIKKLIEGLS